MREIKKQKAFTLVELLVVIAIIVLLASVVLIAVNQNRRKARDTKRAADIDQIYKALVFYNETYGCLPRTSVTICPGAGAYSEPNAGGWDYSSQGGFMTFLSTAGIMATVPVDPLNTMTGDGTPAGTYAYKYFCYPSAAGSPGLHLGYYSETMGYVIKNMKISGGWTDNSFYCK